MGNNNLIENDSSLIKKNLILNIIKTIMTIIFPLITFPYASRILLPVGMGKVNYVLSIVGYFQLIASLGINTYAISAGARLRHDLNKLSKFCTEILIINIISTAISYILLLLTLNSKYLQGYQTLTLISSLSIIFNTLGISWLYNIIEDFKYITIRTILFQFISLISLFLFVKNTNDIYMYTFLTVFSSVGSGIFNIIHSRKIVKLFNNPLNQYQIRKHLKPIIILFLSSAASTIYMNSDKTMLGILKNDYVVGLYSASAKIVSVISVLVVALRDVLLPRLSVYIARENKSGADDLIKKAISMIYIFIIPSTIGIFLLSSEITVLISSVKFIEASTSLKILVLQLLFAPINGFLAYQILIPYRREKIVSLATLAGAITNIVLNYFLIPVFSLNGAAFATVISEIVVFFILNYFIKEYFSIKTITKNLKNSVLASLPIIIFYFILSSFLNGIVLVISLVFISVVMYALIMFVIRNEVFLMILNSFYKKIKQ